MAGMLVIKRCVASVLEASLEEVKYGNNALLSRQGQE